MEPKLLHTPEGVRDIYDAECREKIYLQEELHKIFKQYGFMDIQTPTFEYFDVFSKEVGTIPSKDLYKFFDREGNTLTLRPDFTPSIARCAAKYYMDEDMPLRFCYLGNVFINETAVYQGRLKETTQLGAELLGDATVNADAEIAALVIRLLLQSGLEQFQLEIGQVEFFKGLLEEAKLDEQTIVTLRELISRKNHFGVEELLSKQNISEQLKTAFLHLPELFGSIEVLERARALTTNERAQKALDRLQEIYELLTVYNLDRYVSFDLGMLSKYNYYTGILFQAFTIGTGEAIVKGGRYDNLLSLFGKNSAAIGFSLMLDQLILAISRQKLHIPAINKNILFLYDQAQQKQAILLAELFRKRGEAIEFVCRDQSKQPTDYIAFAKRQHMKDFFYLETETVLSKTDLKTNAVEKLDMTKELQLFA